MPVFCFCSGYAHYLMADAQKREYPRRIPGKLLRFLTNYWIVLAVFSLLGLFFDRSGAIPGSWAALVRHILVLDNSYNGAWWFVATYLILLLLSPLLAALTKRLNGVVLMGASFCVYFVAYILRFKLTPTLPNAVTQWIWDQLILLGTSQIGYLGGMVCRRYGLIGSARSLLQNRTALRLGIILVLPAAAFLGHCIVESAFVAPFTAAAVLLALFLVKLPLWAEKLFLLLGAHSTNIWLVHMFFYAKVFTGFAFLGTYPVFVLALMMAACFASSALIELLYRPVLGWIGSERPRP